MRRIDEEAYFLIGFFPLFSQDYYSQSDACNGYDNYCIEYQRPETEPEGLLDNDVHTAFLQDNTTVFVGEMCIRDRGDAAGGDRSGCVLQGMY